ncbi:hypothetical protein Q1695_003212 [Nippostrongylus brasiliensis]|nr:hypothetical protein Q1695_003212 [Nippostrongylus brasiliensis]
MSSDIIHPTSSPNEKVLIHKSPSTPRLDSSPRGEGRKSILTVGTPKLQKLFQSADYPTITEQVSVDNQIDALEVLTHKSSMVTQQISTSVRADPLEHMNLVERLRQKLNIGNELYRAALAELFCTGFLLFAGCSVNAQFVLSQRRTNEWIAVAVGWGLVLLFAVQMGYRISGAHLNPAVSFFLFTQGKINAIRFIVFAIVQNVGAFLGALTTFVVYYDAISSFDNGTRYVSGPRSTAHIFATYPQPHLSTFGAVIDQIAGTAVLCIGIATITDRRNRIPPFLQPAYIGTLLAVIGMALAMNAGYAINPARDFGPRLFTLCAGYGWRVFSYRNYKWFWIPIVCPMIGAIGGAWMYEFFIGFHIPDDPDTTYIHKILDDRNPEGQLREIHVVEKRP